jgi:hypothetical protein
MINLEEEFWSCKKLTITKNNLDCYLNNITLGMDICKRSKVAVLSLARNCEKNLQKSIDQITKIESLDFKFFIYENDSIDETKNILIDNKNKNSNIKISLKIDGSDYVSDGSRQRTIQLAKYRNVCLEWAKKNCSDFDYILVLDLDADLGFSLNGIYNSISWLNIIPNSGGMGSYSISMNKDKTISHYDTFAMRLNNWYSSTKHRQEEIFFSNFHPKIGYKPISFYSCFGGLAVYKAAAFLEGHYDGSIGCEHVLFHKSIRDKGYNMYLNPSSIFFAVAK